MNKIALILLFLLVGCQTFDSGSAKEPTEQAQQPPTEVHASVDAKDGFSIQASVPEQVQVNTAVTMEAKLTNASGQSVEIATGEPVFYYIIEDEAGHSNPITRNDIAMMRPLAEDGAISEQYSYNFKTPGVYTVVAVAEFTRYEADGSPINYKLETEPTKVEVLQ
ncbi:hypothetical protein [Paenibacillus senegalimassiliensis]|uniref:hypothetical protein n=1 Tax=Paenibacillus senegalimassiliensis TaxID=1737426 RepID=UPI00073E2F5D|nr:hypothetical protein [Paenibacillus senegalimassiliensis]